MSAARVSRESSMNTFTLYSTSCVMKEMSVEYSWFEEEIEDISKVGVPDREGEVMERGIERERVGGLQKGLLA